MRFSNNGLHCIESASALKFTDYLKPSLSKEDFCTLRCFIIDLYSKYGRRRGGDSIH